MIGIVVFPVLWELFEEISKMRLIILSLSSSCKFPHITYSNVSLIIVWRINIGNLFNMMEIVLQIIYSERA